METSPQKEETVLTELEKYKSLIEEQEKVPEISKLDTGEIGEREKTALFDYLKQFQIEDESKRKETVYKINAWVTKVAFTLEQEVIRPLLDIDPEKPTILHRKDLPKEVSKALDSKGVDSPETTKALIDYFQNTEAGGTSYNIVNLRIALEQLVLFRTILPNVVPYYAIKTCPDPILVRSLCWCNSGFDCASWNEIGFFFFIF